MYLHIYIPITQWTNTQDEGDEGEKCICGTSERVQKKDEREDNYA